VANGRRGWRVVTSRTLCVAGLSLAGLGWVVVGAGPALAATPLNGTGSSFAAPAITQWDADVSHAPYSLTVNYSSSSSGQGRYEFTQATTDFAVSDVGYVNSSVGATPPSFPYEFIPITAAGVAFMYNIPGLNQPLQLTAYTACLALTGQVKNWNDPAFEQNGANAGSNLSTLNIPIVPVTEEDPAGTNYVLEEYCIDEEPSVWAQYAKNVAGTLAEGVGISATTPGSNWVPPGNGYDDTSTAAVAAQVASSPGGVGAVQENYATDQGFTGSNPAQAVAAVQNASGDFTLPTPVDVASALAYATQLANGTHQLDFNGSGKNVYNPSTYSYLLTPTTGWSSSKGAVMSAYVNYVLTLGQQEAPSMDFASLGLTLEEYGIDQIDANVPGFVATTAAEAQGYACGDFTIAEVKAGATTITCGVGQGPQPPVPPGAPSLSGSPASSSTVSSSTATTLPVTTTTIAKKTTVAKKTTTAKKTTVAKKATTTTTIAKHPTTGPVSTGVRAAIGGETVVRTPSVDPGETTTTTDVTGSPAVALKPHSSPLAFTGFDPFPLLFAGGALVFFGWFGRRQALRRLRRSAP
jgi:ABC-type phosphate transport system substrate-binding protein